MSFASVTTTSTGTYSAPARKTGACCASSPEQISKAAPSRVTTRVFCIDAKPENTTATPCQRWEADCRNRREPQVSGAKQAGTVVAPEDGMQTRETAPTLKLRALLEQAGAPFSVSHHRPGEIIFRQGDESNSVMHIEEGRVRLSVSSF